jgi:hypothetical protein
MSSRARRWFLALLALVLGGGLAVLSGCDATQHHARATPWADPLDVTTRRPLVFDSPRLQTLNRQAGYSPGEAPWYADRNDLRLSVAQGYEAPTVERSATLTYDRQSQYGRQVTSYYSETTYRTRYRATSE